jgi:nitroimidazol reductase NimA-like FMN-containing flavoprotein (pyridoxamine 5'-phosphate oxidase superfamily)
MDNGEITPELQEISETECLRLLRRHSLGRIAVVVEGQPQIFPVNYALQDRIIVFRTAPGTKLSYAPLSRVAFEIDEYNSESGVGWSVMVQGVAQDATTALDDLSWTARGAMPHPVAPGVRTHRVAIDSQNITGRYFRISVVVPSDDRG